MSAPTVDATTEAPVEATAEVAETPVDLNAFNDAVTNAISDGTPSDVEIKAVRRAYGELEPRRGKYAARTQLDEDIRVAVEAGNMPQAQALFALKDVIADKGGLKSGKGASTPKDPTEAHLQRVAGISIAYALVSSNIAAGVDPAWEQKLNTVVTTDTQAEAQRYRDWLEGDQNGDEPEVSELAKSGARISLGRAPKGQGRKPKKDETPEAPATAEADSTPAPAPSGDAPSVPAGWEG